MAGISTYLANGHLNLLRNTAFSALANTYLALGSGTATAAGLGSELSGSNYSRKAIAAADFSAASAGAMVNANAITTATASGTWIVTEWATYDASSAGNMLYYGQFTTAKIISSGEAINIAAGALSLGES